MLLLCTMLTMLTMLTDFRKIHIDGHESKPAISILAIVQESRKTSAFRYFSSYSFYFIT